MALGILDAGMFTPVINYELYPGQVGAGFSVDTSGLTDSANASPTFDTAHTVYTSPIVDQASQNSIGDNSNGLQDPLQLNPTLTYAYSTGYSNERSTSQALTVGLSQSFNIGFLGEGASTTLTASGTFSWGQSTSENKTTTVTNGISAPFQIPKGKIFEEKLLFTQEKASIPYTTTIDVKGNLGLSFFGLPFNNYKLGVGDGFSLIQNAYSSIDQGAQNIPTPDAYKDVNWRDVHSNGAADAGYYVLHGNLTIEDAGTAKVIIYDITPPPIPTGVSTTSAPAGAAAAAIQANYDPAVPIGVHQTLDDAGRTFIDSPFNDYVDGGAGNDHIRLSGGDDIAYAAGGNDIIEATGVGQSLLDGGDGDDRIDLTSSVAFNTIMGGAGNDRIRVDAPAAYIDGGEGDDGFWLNGANAGGTVIVDTQGANHLEIDKGGIPLNFERVSNSDNLYILLDGGDTYDRTRDVVWADFFANPDNQVDGLTTAEIADRAVTFQPAVPAPVPAATSTGQDDSDGNNILLSSLGSSVLQDSLPPGTFIHSASDGPLTIPNFRTDHDSLILSGYTNGLNRGPLDYTQIDTNRDGVLDPLDTDVLEDPNGLVLDLSSFSHVSNDMVFLGGQGTVQLNQISINS